MAKHAVRFKELVQDARSQIKELTIEEVLARHTKGELLNLIDVREDREWLHSHIPGARHLSKGTIERDVELYYRTVDIELILYCADGNRSALAAASLNRMGFEGACAMSGGFKAWKAAGGPIGL
jgi:rhodanese-related sulfurtransferase